MSGGVAPDGSPVGVYLALPAGDTPDIIGAQLSPGSSILELGSGPGRITHPLVAMGHVVVAVDDSPEMLSHVCGAETVLADLFTLDLTRRFDAVVAGSHLINAPTRDRRIQLLDVCRRHVAPNGVVLIERYDPEWASNPQPSRGDVSQVEVGLEPIDVRAGSFSARVTYTLHGRSWAQDFTARAITDADLAAEAAEVGLELAGWPDEARTWARLEPRGDRRRASRSQTPRWDSSSSVVDQEMNMQQT